MLFNSLFTVLALSASLISSVSAGGLHTKLRTKRNSDYCVATWTDCLNGAQITYSCCVGYLYNTGEPVTTACHDEYTSNKNKCNAADTAAQYNGISGCQDVTCCDSVFATQTGYSKAAGAANAATCVQATPGQMTQYQSTLP